MTVTIIIPVYGVERYVGECARSLFAQTYKDIEYVFCDDCTPDRSIDVLREVIDEFPERKEHVQIIRNERNLGLGGTRRHLISRISTDYFLIVDSDDLLPENAVEVLVGRMKETDTDIVDAAYAEYSDGKAGEAILPSHDTGSSYLKKVWVQNTVSLRVWGRLYKTSVLLSVPDLFVEGIDFAEDTCATSRLAAVTTRSWTDEVVYYYRTDNATSYTQNISEKNILSYFRACQKILSFYRMRGHLPLALEIGILNCYRECCKSHIDTAKADEIIRYVPEHYRARLLFNILHRGKWSSWANTLYKFIRAWATV